MEKVEGNIKAMWVLSSLTLVWVILGSLCEIFEQHANWIKMLSWIFYLFAYVSGGYYSLQEAWKSIIAKKFDVNILMILSAIGAASIGELQEGAVLMFLFSLSNTLENYAMNQTNKGIASLLKAIPQKATRIKQVGKKTIEEEVTLNQLSIDDIIIVKSGEKIPIDGLVVSGRSEVNEASITGEATLVNKTVGSKVFAGSMSYEGILHVQIISRPENFVIAQIVKIVREAKEKKATTEKFTDNVIGQYYAIGVLVISVLYAVFNVFVFDFSIKTTLYKSMTLMVSASPCALVLSIPISILSALANATGKGVLFKGGSAIEKTAKIDTIAFDKTGTLTFGKFSVEQINIIDEEFIVALGKEQKTIQSQKLSTEEILLLLFASLEKSSNHPLADAILEKAQQQQLTLLPTKNFKNIPGVGIVSTIYNTEYSVSKPYDLIQTNKALANKIKKLQDKNQSVIVLSVKQKPIGCISLKDKIRPEAASLIRKLTNLGIKNITLLTGDNKKTTQELAEQLHLTSYHANLMPQEKLDWIKKMQKQGRIVAMVGDGINDAPALAQAHVGIAMGIVGTDIAIETADVLLMNDNLNNIPWLLQLAKKANTLIKQNIIFASIVITLLIIFTILNYISLPLGVVGHEGSTIIVALNGLRLLRYKQ